MTRIVTPQACNLPRETIEGFAESVFSRLGIEPGADDSEFVDNIGGCVHRADTVSYSLVVHEPERFDVYVPQTCGLFDTRQMVARALGHYVLHFSQDADSEMLVPTNLSGNATWEAGVFALAFLAPSSVLRTEMIRANNVIVDVASILRVEPSVIRTRARQLGLLAA